MITWNSALKNLVIDLRIGSQLMSQIILLLEGTQQVPRHLSYKYYWMLYMYIYIYSDGYDYLNLIIVGFSNGRNWDYTRKLLDGA